ncbi:MAG: cupin domain-containing protein [Haliea sp.]
MNNSTDKNQVLQLEPEMAAQIAAALVPIEPDAACRTRMRARVLAHAGKQVTSVVRAGAGDWRLLVDGVHVKTLRLDRARTSETSLWRLDPGSHIPPHAHRQEEECLVLEGSIHYAGEIYEAGDYLLTPPGHRHAKFYAPTGALLLIRSELVPTTSRLTRFLYRLWDRLN